MPVTLFLHTDRNNDKKAEITLWMENCFQLFSSFPLIWNMAHSPDWEKKELWQMMFKQYFFLLGSCNSTVWLFLFSLTSSLYDFILIGDDIWGECGCSVSESSLDDPEQQASVQAGCPAKFALFCPSQNQVRNYELRVILLLFFLLFDILLFLLHVNLVGMFPEWDNIQLNRNWSVSSSFTSVPRHDALKLGKDFAKETNCSVSNIVCLLSLTPQAVLAAQMKTSRVLQTPAYAYQI